MPCNNSCSCCRKSVILENLMNILKVMLEATLDELSKVKPDRNHYKQEFERLRETYLKEQLLYMRLKNENLQEYLE